MSLGLNHHRPQSNQGAAEGAMNGLPAAKKRRLSPRDDAEADFERRPRLAKKAKDGRLPVKTAQGWVERSPSPSNEAATTTRPEETLESESERETLTEPAQPVRSQHEQVLEAQEELARIAGLVSEDPEEHYGLLKRLQTFAASGNPAIAKLALATQLAVYKDIIPGYRIRPASEQDMKAKLSKEVKRLRNFEQGLVMGYRDYIRDLVRLAKGSTRKATEAQNSIASVAIICACTLLGAVPHFNFRGELLDLIVRKLSSRTKDQDFNRCRMALETLFAEDEDSNASLDAVGILTRMMKAKDYKIHPSVLDTFLHLRLLSEFIHKGSRDRIDKRIDDEPQTSKPKQKREFRTKKLRKTLKETKAVEKEMQEADAEVSYEDRDKNQSEMLKLVFVAYFRVLKARSPSLMGAVLEGLARYAHLINQDFFGDILEALRDLVASAASLQDDEGEESDDEQQDARRDVSREALLCIITAFALLQGQDVAKSASALHLDLNFFVAQLYRTILPASLDANIELKSRSLRRLRSDDTKEQQAATQKINVQTTIVLLLRSLSSVVHPPNNVRSVTPLRLAAYTKQLAIMSLQLPEKSCLAVIGLLRQVTKANGAKIAALWHTEERKGDGVFDPLRDEVEGSNPFAATVWEGELLRLHYCPQIREGIIGLEKQVQACRA